MTYSSNSTPRRPALRGLARMAVLVAVLVAALLAGALAVPAGTAVAEDPPGTPIPTSLSLTGPDSGTMREQVTLKTVLSASDAPLAGATVIFQRWSGTAWQDIRTRTTDADGTITITVVVPSLRNTYRTTYAGDETHQPSTSANLLVRGIKAGTTLRIGGSRQVIDGRAAVLTGQWRTWTTRKPIARGLVKVWSWPKGGSWHLLRKVRTDSDGNVRVTVRPRVDTRYRMRGVAGSWYRTDVSGDRFVDNLPPMAPWHAPARAPRPKWLAAQPRGFGAWAHVVVTRIPDGVWRSMVGVSWHPGCPVGRAGLRLIRANYWGFDGYRHRGELVVNAHVVGKYVGVLRDFYQARIPMRAMYRVDRFGYNRTSGGGNDYASMEHDNTSAFNCRWVSGNPGVRSPHSTGRAFDINTWENPYRSNWGWLPNSWWVSHSDPRVAWRSADHPVVRILRANGFRWTYRVSDSQHFDGRVLPVGATFTAS